MKKELAAESIDEANYYAMERLRMFPQMPDGPYVSHPALVESTCTTARACFDAFGRLVAPCETLGLTCQCNYLFDWGACCFANETCTNATNLGDCAIQGGSSFNQGATCDADNSTGYTVCSVLPNTTLGACCLGNLRLQTYGCSLLNETECDEQGGNWHLGKTQPIWAPSDFLPQV